MRSKPTVMFAANRGYALSNSRTELIQHFIDSGWQVVLSTSDDEESRALCDMGAYLEPVIFNRGGLSTLGDIYSYQRLVNIFRKWKPNLVHHFHAKPVILGSLAARRILKEEVRIVNTITGLGHAFIKGGIVARLAGVGYRYALPASDTTIFQNRDDQALFMQHGWGTENKAVLITGSGVDIRRFEVADRSGHSDQNPVVVMLGRLLWQKGVSEFIDVARRIRARWHNARFLWAGEEDPVHPDSVSAQWLRSQSGVDYLGRLVDVAPLLKKADLLLFPSYREGVPRVILEAAATGLPAVGFDVPGVREAVVDHVTGYLVPHGDVESLSMRVMELLENPKKREIMGKAARRMVETQFDIKAIQRQYFNVYRRLDVGL